MGIPEQQRRRYLETMGIQAWEIRDREPSAVPAPVQSPAHGVPPQRTNAEPHLESTAAGVGIAAADWGALEEAVRRCTLCPLHETRTQTVFGVGNRRATWLFVGEAPGFEEDRQGEPFVGRAGQLLNSMLFAIGLKREEVYIANVLKCRPPANRDPMGEEVIKCEPYLHRQVKLIEPKIIVALGRFAAQSLLKTNDPIGRLRGRQYIYGDTGIPLVVTYHPAYLLRKALDKRKAWHDLRLAKSVLEAS